MVAQTDIDTKEYKEYDTFYSFVQDVKSRFPLPENAIWMACTEKSEFFIKTSAQNNNGMDPTQKACEGHP